MGCDGGSIPTRDEMVRVRKSAERLDPEIQRHAAWACCHASQEPLREPLVSCELGYLFNKEALIKFLLSKDDASEIQRNNLMHIKSLKDVVDLQLAANPALKDEGNDGVCQFACPVLNTEMSGLRRFCYIRTTGWVYSEKALQELKCKACPQTGIPFEQGDIVTINPSPTEREDMRLTMLHKAAEKADRKRKKKKKKKSSDASSSNDVSQGVKRKQNMAGKPKKKQKTNLGIRPEDLERHLVEPLAKSAAYKSLFTSSISKDDPRRQIFTCEAHSIARKGNKAL